jgi:ApbE superfamily uncharacterized protein (UPF0280 family)
MYAEEFEYRDTILKVKCDKDIGDFVRKFIVEKRQEIEAYIARDRGFQTSFEPVKLKENPPEIAKIMADAAKPAGVGPMAAVAGAVSELLVREAVKKGAKRIIAENGGDICLYGDHDFVIQIFAGKSPLSNKIGFSLNPGNKSYGVCTSSASVGHSISLGKSDAVTVFAKSAAVADAFATAIGNRVEEVEDGIKFAKKFVGKEIDGVVIIKGEKIGKIGKVPEFLKLGCCE